jgi:tetratricopeptide (TPR) repeat protein
MQKVILVITLVCGLTAPALSQRRTAPPDKSAHAMPTPAVTASPNPLRDADRLFSHGEDAARDRQSFDLIEKAVASEPNNYQLLWRLARVCYYVGDEAPSADKLKYFERGIQAGQQAIALQPGAVEGHFWLGVCYGGFSEVKGALKALRTVKKIRAEMETVLRLNHAYEDGSAYLALGEMDRELPRLFGGSASRAISYLEKGLTVAPKNINLRLSLARAYLDSNRRDDANKQLQEILQTPVNPARAREHRSVQEKARRLLNR